MDRFGRPPNEGLPFVTDRDDGVELADWFSENPSRVAPREEKTCPASASFCTNVLDSNQFRNPMNLALVRDQTARGKQVPRCGIPSNDWNVFVSNHGGSVLIGESRKIFVDDGDAPFVCPGDQNLFAIESSRHVNTRNSRRFKIQRRESIAPHRRLHHREKRGNAS